MKSAASRREFLELAGATLALAGVAGCTRQPPERIVPYVHPPESIVPGRPLYYATALSERGYGTGVLVESHMGRPTKIEGNPDHPASLGATDVWMQAAILELYDPERSQVVRSSGGFGTYEVFVQEIRSAMDRERSRAGRGLRLLTGRIGSPSLLAMVEALLAELPEARWHSYEPASRENARQGARLAFGRGLVPAYQLAQADVILSLDSDFLYLEPGHLRYTREFAGRREPHGAGGAAMNRLYAVEPSPSVTGTMADHRLALPAASVEVFAKALARLLGIEVAEPRAAESWREFLGIVAEDLRAHRGRSLVIAGDSQPPAVHAMAHAMNGVLGNLGASARMLEPAPQPEPASLEDLVEELQSGAVELLLMLDVNPVYTAPADLEFGRHLQKAALRVHLGLYPDETAALCHWHLPRAHELEAWGDVRAFDGTVTLQQPLIEPLYAGTTPALILDLFSGSAPRGGYDILRAFWRERFEGPELEFERFFRTALHDGLVEGSSFPEAAAEPSLPELPAGGSAPAAEGLEIDFRPDPTIGDGRFSTNAWLQELPKPITKLTWDNAAHLSLATASGLGLRNEEVVEIRYRSRSVEAPVWIVPGQADGVVVLHLGYGRSLGAARGYDAYRVRTSDSPWNGAGAEIRPTGRRYPLATSQEHFTMEGRPLVRRATLEEYRTDPHFVHRDHAPPEEEESLYPSWEYDRYAWGMSINLNTCIGCGACVIACQAENNIPVVGKDGVRNEREMHWIRVDRYFEGTPEAPRFYHQPVPCMHCENAPCEPVCPVAATVHSDEGLNEMVYNRCVGTRYCSNNCPYKVRRFNFLDYTRDDVPVRELLWNPDVTVRSRGVMEKCTYCVQRISAARIEAKKENRPIRDGEVETACQSACPAEAILFGDVNDPDTRVSRRKRDPRDYGLLTELNTRPRTTYIAKLWNAHPQTNKTNKTS